MRRALLLTLMIALAGSAATRKVQYVDTDNGSDSNDGSSWEEAYKTLGGWEAQNTDLTAVDKYLQVYLRGAANDTTGVTITGWTTSATCTIELIEDPNNYHNGVLNDACYQMVMGASATAIAVTQNYVTINGLQITGKATVTMSYNGIFLSVGYGNIMIKNCLIQDFKREGAYAAINFAATAATDKTAYNNILWNCTNGIYASQTDGTFAHNTIVDCTKGMTLYRQSGRTLIAKNNLISGGTTCWSLEGTGGTLTTGYNWTSDATSPDGETYQNKTFTFVGGEDYHLNANQNGLYNSADPSVSGLTTDIDGHMRLDWEGGADEIPNPGKPALVHHNRRSY